MLQPMSRTASQRLFTDLQDALQADSLSSRRLRFGPLLFRPFQVVARRNSPNQAGRCETRHSESSGGFSLFHNLIHNQERSG